MMSAAYTGNLIAALAAPRVLVPFRALQDLASQTEYRVGVTEGSFLQNVFQVIPVGHLHEYDLICVIVTIDTVILIMFQNIFVPCSSVCCFYLFRVYVIKGHFR